MSLTVKMFSWDYVVDDNIFFCLHLNIVHILFNLVRYRAEAKREAIVYVHESSQDEKSAV